MCSLRGFSLFNLEVDTTGHGLKWPEVFKSDILTFHSRHESNQWLLMKCSWPHHVFVNSTGKVQPGLCIIMSIPCVSDTGTLSHVLRNTLL